MKVSLSSVDTNQEEHTPLCRISKLKVTPKINKFEYLDTLYDI